MNVNSEKSPKIDSLVLTLVATQLAGILLLILFPLTWKTNDDLYMSAITKGYFSKQYSTHLIFINPSIGYLVRFINSLFSTTHGYAVLLNQLNAFSVGMLAYSLLAFRVNVFRVMLFALALNIFLLNTGIDLQFTVIASQLAIGVWLFLFVLCDSHKPHFLIVFCLLLAVFFSTSLRLDAFFLVSMVFLPLALPRIISTWQRFIGLYATIIVLSLGLYIFNASQYKTPEWQSFKALYKARTLVIDAPKINAEVYDNRHLNTQYSYNEYQLLMGSFFEVNDKFNTDQLKKFAQLLREKHYRQIRLHEVDKKFIFFFITLLAISVLGFALSKRRYFLLVSLGLILAIAPLAYLSIYRVIPDRVIIPVLIGGLFLIFYGINENALEGRKETKTVLWLFTAGLVMLAAYRISIRANQNNTALQGKLDFARALQSEIKTHAAYHCGIIATPFIQQYLQMEAIMNEQSFLLANGQQLIPFGWLTYSPIQFEVFERFGLKNEHTFESVADKADVLIVSDLNNLAFSRYLKSRYPHIKADTLSANHRHNFCLIQLHSK